MFIFCGHPVHVVYRILRLPCICRTPPVLSASLHVIDKIKQSECVRILHSQVTDDISHLDILGCIVRSYIPLHRSWFWNEPTIYLITSSQNIECSQPTIETQFSLNFRLTMMCFMQGSDEYKSLLNKNRLSSTSSKDSGHNSGNGSIDRSSTGSSQSSSSHSHVSHTSQSHDAQENDNNFK